MRYYLIYFVTVWICWLLFADKKRWREIFPVSFFASLLGATTDIIMFYYPLWAFENGSSAIPYLLWDYGMYIVVTYLFIQWLPEEKTVRKMVLYWFVWTAFAIGIEWVQLKLGRMTHHQWWRIWYSYIADWVLFFIFYKYHQIFQLEKLSPQKNKPE